MRRCWAVALVALALARPAAARDTHLLVVTGVEGDPDFGAQYDKWATALIDAARHKGGVADANITYLADRPARDPSRVQGRSTREGVEKAFADIAARARPDDEVVIVLFGHGSFDGRQASFNLPGPDLSATDCAALVAKLSAQRVVFVNTSSSSGGFLQPLAGPGRVVVTATRTGGERNETRFPAYFVEAFGAEAADQNRDGTISMAEAFEYARARTVKAYEQDGLLLTEHATLEDASGGSLASMLSLSSARAQAAAEANVSDPVLKGLIEERQALERQIADLKLRKDVMPAAQYDAELERLLTALALKTRTIQERQVKK